MLLELEMGDLPRLKTEIRAYHSDARASIRVEALARGLGLKSYAALRSLVCQRSVSVEPNDEIFAHYLADRSGVSPKPRVLSRSLARVIVRKAMERIPNLTERGLDSAMPTTYDERQMTHVERVAAFKERRDITLNDWAMDQFELALIYLDIQEQRLTINRQYSSYGLKHRAENLSRMQNRYTHLGDYVSNGMLIAAAIVRGFDYRPTSFGSPNAYFNISSKTIHATWPKRSVA